MGGPDDPSFQQSPEALDVVGGDLSDDVVPARVRDYVTVLLFRPIVGMHPRPGLQ